MTKRTTQDFTYVSPARKIHLFIPAGTTVEYVGTNGGMKTTTNHAVSDPIALPGCDAFDAKHYWYWVPDSIISN